MKAGWVAAGLTTTAFMHELNRALSQLLLSLLSRRGESRMSPELLARLSVANFSNLLALFTIVFVSSDWGFDACSFRL
jgi:hypothetical protein